MLRHDLSGALAGIAGGVGQIASFDLDPSPRPARPHRRPRPKCWNRSLSSRSTAPGCSTRGGRPGRADRPPAPPFRRRGRSSARHSASRWTSGLPARLRLDRTALMRIFDNLLAEAIEQGAGGAVSFAASNEPDAVVFRVTGERAGPSWSAQSRAARPRPGSAGRADARRPPRRASRVARPRESGFEASLRFPASLAVAAPHPAAPSGPSLAGLRILLAEDNPTNQMVASNMLRALDAEVVVQDGVEALERFDDFAADSSSSTSRCRG